MRTLGTRRAVLVAGGAAVAAVALAGCSAGQVAETSLKRPSNQGVNANNANSSVLIRNLSVPFDGSAGYPVDKPAPLQLSLFNQTTGEIRVTVSSSRPTDGTGVTDVITATTVKLAGPAPSSSAGSSGAPAATPSGAPTATPSEAPTATPSGAPTAESSGAPTATPSQADDRPDPAVITLPPMGSATFLPGDQQSLQLSGLSAALTPGRSVYVTFSFSNGVAPLTVPAPVGVPFSPVSRAPGIEGENVEE